MVRLLDGRPRLGVRVAAGAAIAVLCLAAVQSVRFAAANFLIQQGGLASIQKAIALTPLDSQARYTEAQFLAASEPLGDRDEAALRMSVALNPLNANAWMALGMKEEAKGNAAAAESLLLKAAGIDHTFKPAWTLANYYARSNQEEKFWNWIRTGIDMVEPRNQETMTFDPYPMFALCWQVSTDAGEIFTRAIPPKPHILVTYIAYLVESKRIDAAAQAAEPLLGMAGRAEYAPLAGFCDILIANGKSVEAVRIWNALIARKLIPLSPLDPPAGISLSNGSFQNKPLDLGFDWRALRPGGVYGRYSASGPFELLEMDGEEPEHCELLYQWIPVLASRKYRFDSTYETRGITGQNTGLHWSTSGPTDGVIAAHPPGAGPGAMSFEFPTGRTQSLERLVLRYDRAAGTTRPKGTLKILSARLRLLP